MPLILNSTIPLTAKIWGTLNAIYYFRETGIITGIHFQKLCFTNRTFCNLGKRPQIIYGEVPPPSPRTLGHRLKGFLFVHKILELIPHNMCSFVTKIETVRPHTSKQDKIVKGYHHRDPLGCESAHLVHTLGSPRYSVTNPAVFNSICLHKGFTQYSRRTASTLLR